MFARLVPCLMGLLCTLTLEAPLISSPSLSLSQTNATVPSAFPLPSSSNNLPPSPYYYYTKSSPSSKPILIKFYSYRTTLPTSLVHTVLNTALRDVYAQLHPQTLIPDRALIYSSENVHLLVYQEGEMTWGVLESLIGGFFHFVQTYECVGFDFDVGGSGNETPLGTGVLMIFGR